MKVVVVAKSFTRGGAASGARNLVRALRAADLEVVEVDATRQAERTGKALFRLLERAGEKILFGDECHCFKVGPASIDLSAVEAQERPDIIQFCDISGNTVSFSQLSSTQVPTVHRLSDLWPYGGPFHYKWEEEATSLRHRLASSLLSRLVQPGVAQPDVLVTPSAWLAERISDIGVDEAGMVLIRNATASSDLPAPVPTPGAPLRLGFISDKILDPRKGFDRLPPLLDGVCATGVRLSLDVFGMIPSGQEIHAAKMPIRYHGPFPSPQIDRVYDQLDVVLCPSRADNSPNVVCEAMARGRPVVGQQGTGMESYIEEGSTGMLVDFGDSSRTGVETLAHGLKTIEANYARFSEAARQETQEHLTFEAIGGQYRDLYQHLSRPEDVDR